MKTLRSLATGATLAITNGGIMLLVPLLLLGALVSLLLPF